MEILKLSSPQLATYIDSFSTFKFTLFEVLPSINSCLITYLLHKNTNAYPVYVNKLCGRLKNFSSFTHIVSLLLKQYTSVIYNNRDNIVILGCDLFVDGPIVYIITLDKCRV